MPIRPENRQRYPKHWKALSDQIRFERAGGRCECEGECGLHRGRRCKEKHGEAATWAKGKIILTVAHLDHNPETDDPAKLKAMCQRCHLRYDREHHAETRIKTTSKKRGQGLLGFIATVILIAWWGSGCSVFDRQKWDEQRSRDSWLDVYENLPTTKASE